MAAQVMRRRFTVSEYYRMAEAGILHEDDRVELIEGEIVEMAPIGSRHAACVNRLNNLFARGLVQQAIISVQNPIRLDEHSEPQPDISILRQRSDYYSTAHPGPQDVLLLVEVCDSSVSYDRDFKIPLYARAGIVECWLVLLDEGLIEVYRSPGSGDYREVLQVRRGETLSPLAFPGIVLQVDAVLPSAG